jgi:hypothetical protein
MPDGEDLRVGFSLAFVSAPAAPWLGHFACQHYAPQYFAQPQYLTHANTADRVRDVWISGEGAVALADHMGVVIGADGVREAPGRIVFKTPTGAVVLADPKTFEAAFGVPPPHPQDGPHLAGLTIACATLDTLSGQGLEKVGERLVLPPAKGFGAAIAFSA